MFLYLQYNQIAGLYNGTFDGIQSLEHLYVAYNQIAGLDLTQMSCFAVDN